MDCVHPHCNNPKMTDLERETEFLTGWVGITMYEGVCTHCFNLLKEEM